MASGVVYLVNFPDGSQQAFNRLGDAEPVKGDEFPPEWIIDTIQLAKGESYTPDGLPITYEVWVERQTARGSPALGRAYGPRQVSSNC